MINLADALADLGFWEDTTPEENITIFGMDFPEGQYLILTDYNGKTPLDAKQGLLLACYNAQDCYLWGSEVKNLASLTALCESQPAGSAALLAALKNASSALK